LLHEEGDMSADREATIALIARAVAAGKLEERWAVAALKALAEAGANAAEASSVSIAAVLEALDREPLPRSNRCASISSGCE
jgi:hypothetical protein